MVQLLIHFDGADEAQTYTAESGQTITFVNQAKIDDAQKEFGATSLALDGTGDYVTVPASTDWNFAGDFTIDLWIRTPTNNYNQTIIKSVTSDNWTSGAATNDWILALGSDAKPAFYVKNVGAIGWAGTALANNTWYHIAVVRSSGVTSLYVGGTAAAATLSSSATFGNTKICSIGQIETNLVTKDFIGWIDEVRIINGTAAWTSNFTPYTSAYDLDGSSSSSLSSSSSSSSSSSLSSSSSSSSLSSSSSSSLSSSSSSSSLSSSSVSSSSSSLSFSSSSLSSSSSSCRSSSSSSSSKSSSSSSSSLSSSSSSSRSSSSSSSKSSSSSSSRSSSSSSSCRSSSSSSSSCRSSSSSSSSWSSSSTPTYIGRYIIGDWLYIVTDSPNAELIEISLIDPSVYTKYPLDASGISIDYAKDLVYNNITSKFYIASGDGYVTRLDILDLDSPTHLYVGEDVGLNTITSLDDFNTVYMSSNPLYVIDGTSFNIINTDVRTQKETEKILNTQIDFIFGSKINADIRTKILKDDDYLNCDLRFRTTDYNNIDILEREDFAISIDGTLLTDDDLILSSIKIIHTADNRSIATFSLARKHDDINNPTTITNNNTVIITLNNVQVFSGLIENLSCNSNNETVEVTARSADIWAIYNISTVELPLSSVNTQIHPYDILLNDISIEKPYTDTRLVIVADSEEEWWTGTSWSKHIEDALTFLTYTVAEDYLNSKLYWNGTKWIDPTTLDDSIFSEKNPKVANREQNPKIYNGIIIDRGNIEVEGHRLTMVTANGELTALRLKDGNFEFKPGYTYFWFVDVKHKKLDWPGFAGIYYNRYIGTSLTSLSTDLYDIIGADYSYQIDLGNTTTPLGYYTVGSAPFKTISTKNGTYIPAGRREDTNTGLYSVIGKRYDYQFYLEEVGNIEYQKLFNINGDILPETSATIELTLDAYLYYKLELLTRINITNTTTTNIYKNTNGFPISIKQITIDSNTMKVSISADNKKSEYELELLDGLYPTEPLEREERWSLIAFKYDLPSKSSQESKDNRPYIRYADGTYGRLPGTSTGPISGW